MNGFIRQATKDDIPTLQHLKTVGALQAYGKKHDQVEIKRWLDERASEDYFEGRMDEGVKFFVVEHHGYALGMSSLRLNKPLAEFGNLYCSVQGLGLGSSLVMFREQEALSKECTHARVRVWSTNIPALGFFVYHGFEPDGVETSNILGNKLIVMTKTLAH